MNKFSRIWVLIISSALVFAFFVPVWEINLEAPQYPEGLGMKIWVNKLSGDINTINGLNHYIGMQFIVEDSIPELKYMPYLLGFLIAFGILVSLIKRKALLYIWVTVFVLLGIVGVGDFYLWEYDYGHNLDPHAAIKVEGMSYQPPLWGSKQLLNFVAYSYPDVGGWIILLAGLGAIGIIVYNIFEKKSISLPVIHKSTGHTYSNSFNTFLLAITSLFFFSCDINPQPLKYGTDLCDHCKMGIADERFGAEIVTKKGKVFKFDAVECMVHFNEENKNKAKEFELFLVTDASVKRKLVNASSAHYLFSENLPSPMGANISAYASEEELNNLQKEYPGKILQWEEVRNKILRK